MVEEYYLYYNDSDILMPNIDAQVYVDYAVVRHGSNVNQSGACGWHLVQAAVQRHESAQEAEWLKSCGNAMPSSCVCSTIWVFVGKESQLMHTDCTCLTS